MTNKELKNEVSKITKISVDELTLEYEKNDRLIFNKDYILIAKYSSKNSSLKIMI